MESGFSPGGLKINGFPCFIFYKGVSAAFAVKLFKSWIHEKDINSVAGSLRKVGMDNRLLVSETTNHVGDVQSEAMLAFLGSV